MKFAFATFFLLLSLAVYKVFTGNYYPFIQSTNTTTKLLKSTLDTLNFSKDRIAVSGVIKDSTLNEISGIVASRANKNCYWVHNDSGDKAQIYLINDLGKKISTVALQNITNRDWEDITIGPGPISGKTYLYIADIGDNGKKNIYKYIYRIEEPKININHPNKNILLEKKDISVLTVTYLDGCRDAETLLIDPITKKLYIITKRETHVQIYEIRNSDFLNDTLELVKAENVLPFRMVNGGDISPNGKRILIKNLTKIFYWDRKPKESILDALNRQAIELPYYQEPQGEAIAWRLNGKHFVTLSEMRNNNSTNFYLYK